MHENPIVASTTGTSLISPVRSEADAYSRFETTVERAPVGIAHFDMEGRFLLVNPRLCTIFGFPRDELLALRFHEISFPEDLPRCVALTAQLARGAIPHYTVEKRFNRRDGTFAYVRVIVSAVRDRAGAVEFFLAIVEDLDEYWLAEQARRDAETRLDLALRVSGTGIYRFDFETKRLDWANGMAAVFGYSESEPLQSFETLIGMIHPEDLAGVLENYERSRNFGDNFEKEFRVMKPDGSVRWIADKARVTRDESGKPRYLTGACTDVTALISVQHAERAARAEAERARGLRDEMLAIVAHDLRNPVHTIMLSAGAMAELALSESENAAQLALIRRSAGGMDHLIRDLLDVTQIEMGRLAIKPAPTAIDTTIAEAVALCGKKAEAVGVTIGTVVEPGLPPVIADHARVVQAVGNLVANSVKFTNRGGRVMVRARRVDSAIEVAVEDTGRGMSPDQLPRVFDAYWQADPTSRKGVGLGLAIVRGIIDAHGGTVGVESSPGVGSTFRFTLPLATP